MQPEGSHPLFHTQCYPLLTPPPATAPTASPAAAAGADEGDISTGFVLCSLKDPTPMVSTFECQLVILELLEHNPIFTVGYR